VDRFVGAMAEPHEHDSRDRPRIKESPIIDDSDHVRINIDTNSQSPSSIPLTSDDFKMAETHTFPKGLPDWSNLDVIHKNTLPPRSSFFLYDNISDAKIRDPAKSKTFSLSGKWKFSLAKSPFDAPADFYESKFDASKWGDIEVPGMWQLQGYGRGPQ
jgi:beta-galactosidase